MITAADHTHVGMKHRYLNTELLLCLLLIYLQAAQPRQNYLAVLKLSDLGQGRHGKKSSKAAADDPDDEDDDDESDGDESMSGNDSDDPDSKEPPAKMHHRWVYGRLLRCF